MVELCVSVLGKKVKYRTYAELTQSFVKTQDKYGRSLFFAS